MYSHVRLRTRTRHRRNPLDIHMKMLYHHCYTQHRSSMDQRRICRIHKLCIHSCRNLYCHGIYLLTDMDLRCIRRCQFHIEDHHSHHGSHTNSCERHQYIHHFHRDLKHSRQQTWHSLGPYIQLGMDRCSQTLLKHTDAQYMRPSHICRCEFHNGFLCNRCGIRTCKTIRRRCTLTLILGMDSTRIRQPQSCMCSRYSQSRMSMCTNSRHCQRKHRGAPHRRDSRGKSSLALNNHHQTSLPSTHK